MVVRKFSNFDGDFQEKFFKVHMFLILEKYIPPHYTSTTVYYSVTICQKDLYKANFRAVFKLLNTYILQTYEI